MKIIQYTARPELADLNEQLIRAVFAELARRESADVRYAVLRLADGSFAHLVDNGEQGSALTGLDSFQAFQADVRARMVGAPLVREGVVIGNHRLLLKGA
jgi:hypothetical protein